MRGEGVLGWYHGTSTPYGTMYGGYPVVPTSLHYSRLFSYYFLISFSVIAITSLRDISLRDIVVATTSLCDIQS